VNAEQVIGELKKYAGFSEIYHKTSFRCIRRAKNGETQEVAVDILDAGSGRLPTARVASPALPLTHSAVLDRHHRPAPDAGDGLACLLRSAGPSQRSQPA